MIAVVDQGRIIETGSHEELMAAKGAYYKLVILQTMDEAEDDDVTSLHDEEEKGSGISLCNDIDGKIFPWWHNIFGAKIPILRNFVKMIAVLLILDKCNLYILQNTKFVKTKDMKIQYDTTPIER